MPPITQKGSFKNLDKFLRVMKGMSKREILESYARRGVDALRTATPIDTGLSANSWFYEIRINKNEWAITWYNSHVTRDGVPVVILLQFGHGTGTGGYVQGYDFINPALRPVFDRLADDVWKAVKNA